MTPEQWQRIAAIYDKALGEPAGSRREAVLAAPEAAEVRNDVQELLDAHARAAGVLEASDFLSGDAQVGAYRIIRVLGRGGMGVVYLAEDSRLHRRVALKALPPQLFRDETLRLRLRQEARTAAALSHPGIATIFALEEIDDQLFIASEYLEGQTLRVDLDRGPLHPRVAVGTALEVARALAAAHERGVVHRDLKPENIMRTTSGLVKILDFGLAQFDPAIREVTTVTHLTDAGLLAGTPLYMAPEQLLGQATSIHTDQFGFGVILYELVLGRHPFGTGSLPTIVARVLAAEPDSPTGFDAMPDGVWHVVQRCLQKRPADRYAVTAEIVAAIDETGAAEPVRPSGSIRRSSATNVPLPAPEPPASSPAVIASLTAPNPADASAALWWWQFHQVAVTLAYGITLWPVWLVHDWLGSAGAAAFLCALVSVIVAGSLRLHLWFTAQAYPKELPTQRGQLKSWVRAGDLAFAIALVVTGLVIAGEHTGWGALFVAIGSAAALAALVIEPTTARAAFGDR